MPQIYIDPPWLIDARKHIGLREIVGPKHNATILRMWEAIKSSWFKDDETPWCAGFVGFCLENVGIVSTRSAAARSYEKFGLDLRMRPAIGAIVVFKRDGGGHVGFFVGVDKYGNWLILGGNQGNMVKISPYAPPGHKDCRIVAVRWAGKVPPTAAQLKIPLLTSDGTFLSNEA